MLPSGCCTSNVKLSGEPLDLLVGSTRQWGRGMLRACRPATPASDTSVYEDDAERERSETPIADERGAALQPPLHETLKAPGAQPEQHGRASELKESNETHHGRKATVWRSNDEDRPTENTDRERHRKPGRDAPVAQKAPEVGGRDNAEKTDPCDGETD